MKIISKFHDYYDSVLAHGRDESLVYVRHEKEIKEDEIIDKLRDVLREVPDRDRRYIEEQQDLIPFMIFFCGRTYLGYKFLNKKGTSGTPGIPPKEIEKFAYSAEEIEKIFTTYKIKWDSPSRYTGFYGKDELTMDNLVKAFKEHNSTTDLNLKFKSPVMIVYRENANIKLVINPRLKDYEFAKVMNPYDAFQEISMYLGGVLGAQQIKTTDRRKKKKKYLHHTSSKKVDDKVNIERHGFDYKWGFRKPSGGKKRRKNK